MRNIHEKTKNSVFTKTFRKGIASSLIPLLLMSVCVFLLDTNRSLEQLGDVTVSMLAKNNQIITYMLEDMDRSTRNLVKSSAVVDFAMRPWSRDAERNTELCSLLNNFSDVYDYVENSFFFSPGEDIQIGSSGLISYGAQKLFFEYFEQVQKNGGHYLQITGPGQPTQNMFLATGIPVDSEDPQALLILQIDLERFLAASIDSGVEEGVKQNIYITDQNRNILFSSIDLEPVSEIPELPSGAPDVGSRLVLSNSMLLRYSAYTNHQMGWTYICVAGALSKNSGWAPMLFPLLLSILAACIVGLLMVYQSSRSLYSPLRQLISTVAGPADAMDPPGDEYRWLADHYDQLLNQREEVYEQVYAIRPLLLKKFLASLLNGTQSSPDEILYQIKILEIPFQMTFFNAFLLQIDNYYALPYPEDKKRDMLSQMQAQISACSNESVYCVTAEVSDETILVICNLQSEETAEAAKQIFRSFAEEIREEISGLWPFTVTLGIGRVCHTPEDLPLSCQKARAALAYKIYRGEGSIIDFDEVQAEPRQIYYDFEKIQRLINSVRAGDEKRADRLLHEIFGELYSQKQLPPKQTRDLFQYLTTGIGEIIQTAELYDEVGAPAELEQELAHKTTLPDIEKWLTDLCRRTAAAMKTNSSERVRHNAEQIKAYIDSNITKNISLSSISEHVNYSPTYVSKVFRQHYGTSYIDYLNSGRVKLSQELLSARADLSVKEIGFKVGFNNLQTFFRIFKKYTGMTPLQYREKEIQQ